MKNVALIAVALLSAGAVSAQTVSGGHAQFAAGLNLDPAQYTLPELMMIEQARSENDISAEQFYLKGTNRQVRGGVGQVSQGKAGLAAELGVNAADYSLNELTAMSVASSGDGD